MYKRIIKNNIYSTEFTYSIKDYAEYKVANTKSYSTETVDAVKAMLLYGAFAERYFTGAKDLSTASVLTNLERAAVQYGSVGVFYKGIISKRKLRSEFYFLILSRLKFFEFLPFLCSFSI